jgi:hypothetical protein
MNDEGNMSNSDPSTIASWYATIATVVGSVISTLVGSILYLARMIEAKYKAEIDKLTGKIGTLETLADECTEQRHALAVRLARLEAIHEKEHEHEVKK